MIKETHGPIPLTFPPRGSSCSSERGNGTGIQQAKCPTGQKDRGLVSLSVCKDTGQQPGGGERSNLPFDVDAVTLRI